MIERLFHALTHSANGAADDVLLEALSLGADREQTLALAGLLKRETTHGLRGVIGQYDSLAQSLQQTVVSQARTLYHALRECGQSDNHRLRLAALKLIASGRQGKLAYVLTENLHHEDAEISAAAADAMAELAAWIADGTRQLQSPTAPAGSDSDEAAGEAKPAIDYEEMMRQRPEIESSVARAISGSKAAPRHAPQLVRAATLLADWSGSRTLALLHAPRHGGPSPLSRALQQPPALPEAVDGFLLGATHGNLRSHFAAAFQQVRDRATLTAFARRSHWLRDHQLQACMRTVSRGRWIEEQTLADDLAHRRETDAGPIAEWIVASGLHDGPQDEQLDRLRQHAGDNVAARLAVLHAAMRRPHRSAACPLLIAYLNDPDERLARLAARELARRRPQEYETTLLGRLSSAAPSVRRVAGRAISQASFEQYWNRFDRLPRHIRKQAGKAVFRLLPDALQRLSRRLGNGALEQRLKAMQMAHELDLADPLHAALLKCCNDPHPRIRSKAVTVVGHMEQTPPELLIDRLLNDADARVRANTIDVLDEKGRDDVLPKLAMHARANHSRERANAIKAMKRMEVGAAGTQLTGMLRDDRSEHRISALWTLRHTGWWQLLGEVARIAKTDTNVKVRRYALQVLKDAAEITAAQRKAAATPASTSPAAIGPTQPLAKAG